MEKLVKMRCDALECNERAAEGLETLQEALEDGWVVLRTADGEWEYCSIECMMEHIL